MVFENPVVLFLVVGALAVVGFMAAFAIAAVAHMGKKSKWVRGISLNRAKRCPACGGETMRRHHTPLLLRPIKAAFGARCSYRSCRRCTRHWLAFHAPTPKMRGPRAAAHSGKASG